MVDTTCPKCGAVSGDNWSQCFGVCPMPGSPHFDPTYPPVDCTPRADPAAMPPGFAELIHRGDVRRAKLQRMLEDAYRYRGLGAPDTVPLAILLDMMKIIVTECI